jgi:chromosome segregation ATPase
MKMIELLGGIVIGSVVAFTLKEKILGTQDQNTNKQQELNNLYEENEKFSRRNKELERQVEDLLSELNKVRKKAQIADDNHDDLQDELDRAKKDLKNVRLQNDELARKVREYKATCESQEAEISLLKEKLG